jgi:glycosyltransferase involved in cell wall biosynthesis
VIALVHGHLAFGAVERYVEAIARALGDDALLVHADHPSVAPFAELGVARRTYPPELLGSGLALMRRLAELVRGARIVHVTDVLPPAHVAARLTGRRLVVTHHTPELPRRDSLGGRAWWRLGWAVRPLVIYTSQTDRERDGRRPSRVVPLGIDVQRFGSGKRVLDGTVVGNVARLAEQKGHRTLLEAAALVRARRPDVRFAIAGDGELREELEKRADEIGDVALLGNRSDVPDLLASFAVFAYPSRFEGLCLAVLEAQAAGVPVVATPVGGIRETVVDGETGFLVPVGNAEALAERIVHVLEHPEEARRVAAEARRRVQEFSEERMVAETLAIYDERA